jgi:FKBP-type peptidyl-prolyl cis-trans isomerases 1
MRKGTILVFSLIAIALFCSCKRDKTNDFTVSELGYAFKRCTFNDTAPKAKEGDILYGQMKIKLNDSVVLYSNYGAPERLFKILDDKKGSIDEFLLNLHIGDSAIIVAPADSVAQYVAGINCAKGDKIYFYITISQIISKKEIDEQHREQSQQEQQESMDIQNYIEDKQLKTQKEESGLYFINVKEGTGLNPKFGDVVRVNYAVYSLEGKLIDTNVKGIAHKNGMLKTDRSYEPFSFVLGDDGVIAGWTEGVLLMKKGGRAKLIIPSSLAYGDKSYGPIKPFMPLVFDIILVDIADK